MRATWTCLEPKTRRKILISAGLAVVLSLMDASGVALLPVLIRRFEGRGMTGLFASWATPVLALVLGTLLITKSIGGAGLLFWQSHFLAKDEGDRTVALFDRFFGRPYGETSQLDSGAFIRDLHVSMPMLYRGSGQGLAAGIADGLGIIGLVAVVILSSPAAGISLAIFFVVASRLYNSLIRSRVNELSDRFHTENRKCLIDLNESFGALKTLKAFGTEDAVVQRFNRTRQRYSMVARDVQIFQQASRYYLEIALVLGLGLCLGVVWMVEGKGHLVAEFSLLTGVGARAMPALGRCLTSLTGIRVSGASVLKLEPELREIDAMRAMDNGPVHPAPAVQSNGHRSGGAHGQTAGVDPEKRLIELEAVTFRYPGAHRDALQSISMDLRRGELVAIVGESGAGKTTTVDIIIGLLDPHSGTVRREAGSVGYVAQDTFVWNDSVTFNVAMGRSPSGGDLETSVWDSLEAAQLADWVKSLPDGLNSQLGERGGRMSGGQRQRLGLARAMYGHPSTLLLDEPTSALDTETSRALLTTLVSIKQAAGIIVVTHDPLVAEYADRTITLPAGAGSRSAV